MREDTRANATLMAAGEDGSRVVRPMARDAQVVELDTQGRVELSVSYEVAEALGGG